MVFDRIDKIKDYFRGIELINGVRIVNIMYPPKWGVFPSDDEKIKMCEIVTASGADFIKTSTGFSTAGATKEDVALFAKHVGKDVLIKAAGGIASLTDAEDFINLGASRLGTSRVVKIAKNEKSTSNY